MQFPCTTCGKAFSVERILRDHMRSHVNQYQVGKIVFLPTMCRSSVLSNNVLFQCPACDMTCPTPSILATHMRYRHTTERPLACQVSPSLDAVLFYFSSVLWVQRENQSRYAITCKGSFLRGYQNYRVKNYHMTQKILNPNQDEHCCKEPGCDFTCRAALTLVRHQVESWSTGFDWHSPSGESAWDCCQKSAAVRLPPVWGGDQRWQ